MSSSDTLLAILAPLNPSSVKLPGKPPKKRKEVPMQRMKIMFVRDTMGHVIGLARYQCGASYTQTRSLRLDVESPQDLAAALAGVSSSYRKALIEWIALPWWQQTDLNLLHQPMMQLLKRKGHARKLTKPQAEQIVAAVLTEIRSTSACTRCSTNGVEWNKKTQQWVQCRHCHGTGWKVFPWKERAKRLSSTQRGYRRDLMRPYVDLWQFATAEADEGLRQLQWRRGRADER